MDIKAGPDGCIYVADMYEQRIDHSSHYAGRIDRTNGRIYKLTTDAVPAPESFDYGDHTTMGIEELSRLLEHKSKWHRQTAQRVMSDRYVGFRRPKVDSDASTQTVPSEFEDWLPNAIRDTLVDEVMKADGQKSLELLWRLNSFGMLRNDHDDDSSRKLLAHPDQYVRAWTVRLLCDHHEVPPAVAGALADLAANEPYIFVRKQLASSARRLPAKDALPIIRNLLNYDEDASDIHQPLMLWWALESRAGSDSRQILDVIFNDAEVWQRPLVRQHLAERLMKRYALAGSREELLAASQLLSASPDADNTELLLRGFEEAYKGRSLATIPQQLVDAIANSGGGSTALKLRQGNPEAVASAVAAVQDSSANSADRLQFIEIFGEVRRPEFLPVLLNVVQNESSSELVSAALTAMQAFDDLRVGQTVANRFLQIPAESRLVAETLLASRSVWAEELLTAVDAGKIPTEEISDAGLRKILLHQSSTIADLIAKHWGRIEGATTEQMQADIRRLTNIINSGSGNPKKGKPLYMNNCGKCHILFEEGGRVGPDLTSFKRDNLERILTNIVNPSLEIREGFENFIVVTTDGRVVNGFLADKDSQVVVLRGVDGQNLIFRHEEIEEMQATPRSVMPEGTLKQLTDQQIRDLFAYLRATQPVNY